MKSAPIVLFVAASVSACGLFGKEETESRPAATQRRKVEIVTAVPHEVLATVLPKTVEDWQGDVPQGSLTSAGVHQLSRAGITFKHKRDGTPGAFSLDIVDGTHVPSVNSTLALMAHAVEDVHRMELVVSGYHGVQHWQPQAGTVTAMIVLAGRFLVTLKGNHVPPQLVKQAVAAIDVRKLESLAGVEPALAPAAEQTAARNPNSGAAASTTTAPTSTPTITPTTGPSTLAQ